MTPPPNDPPRDLTAFLTALRELLASEPAVPAAPEVLTVAEAARVLRCDRKTVYAAIQRGELPARRLGRRLVVGRAALTAWLGEAQR